MNEKDEKEASVVRTMPPPPLPAAPSAGDGSLFVKVNRHSTVSRSSTEESSIVTIRTLQRMKADMQTEMMQHIENEIEGVIRKHQMQGEDRMLILSTTDDEERFEEDGTEKLEEGNGRKWFYDMWKKKENVIDNTECTADEFIFLKDEVDRMKRVAEEQARSIEVTSRKFEELRSLVANPSENSDQRQNLNVSPNQPEYRRQSQRMNSQSMFGRTSSALLESSDRISLDQDTFSLMMISPVCSQSWILGCSSFSCQMTLGVMILIGQFKESEDSSIFGVPFKVDDPSVRVAQFLSIILCLSTQSDILSSIKSLFLLGKGSNWSEIIGEEKRQASCCLWITRVGLPNTFRLAQGLLVTFASFVITVQNKNTIDLLKDIASLMVVSEFDNMFFNVAAYGYLGDELQQQTEKITDADPIRSAITSTRDRKYGFFFVRLAFVAILSAMFAGWGIVFRMQSQGQIFDTEFPECGKEHYQLAFDEFGDDKCYGGPFNNLNCKYEDGDCANFNTAYPSCNGEDLADLHNVEEELGNGSCNMTFAIEDCEYDGGDCCPYNVTQSVQFGDGKCDGGLYNTEGCLYDFGDCDSFNLEYPNCTLDDALLMSESSADIILGDGMCDGGGYNSELCGFEYGDCVKGQIGGDIMLSGVRSPNENKINFKMWMSADSTKLLLEMPQTNAVGKYDSFANGKIAGHNYNSDTLAWVHDEGMDKERLQNESSFPELHPMAVAGDGSVVAVGSPVYDDDQFGRVTIFDFWGLRNHQVLIGKEKEANFGWQVDLTSDGTRIAVSSPNSVVNGLVLGKIQIFETNEESSEELWTQIGNAILGKKNNDYIGFYYVGLNSSNGTRVFFSTGYDDGDGYYYTSPQLQTYQIDSPSQEWVELATDILLRPYRDQKELIAVSADGNRFAVSSFNLDTTDTQSIIIYDWTTNANGGSWNQLGPPISSPSNENGFGRSISMDADGTLLVISAVDPECDGRSPFEEDMIYYDTLLEGASTALCGTGSIELYQYKPTNPPWRPFTRVPYIRDINSETILETQHQVRENTILGLQVSLSGDGSVLTASGYDIDGDFGFVKVFNVKELFYVDCLVHDPEEIGNGDCYGADPYYTEECGYDGGDCPLPSAVEGYDDCKVAYPSLIGEGICVDALPYNSEACNYDGGDCPPPSPVEGYPNCFASNPVEIGNGQCYDYLPYNSLKCGFDGDDCRSAEFAPTSSPSESLKPSPIPSTSASPSMSVIPSPIPSSIPSSPPTLSQLPSVRLSLTPSAEPSISAMPTTLTAVVTFELLTDGFPEETAWLLIDNDKDGVIVQSGPGDGETYDGGSLYSFTWTLDRCTSYTFTISNDYYDGLSSPGYAEVKMDSGKIVETLGRIDGNFGSDSSISIFICDTDLTSSPSTSLMPSLNSSNNPSSLPSKSQLPSMSPSISAEPSISAMPTTLNTVVVFELRTDGFPEEMSWSLVDNSQDGAIVSLGPGDGEAYDADSLYSITWTLDRCTFYTFTIYDSYGDGFIGMGYAELTSTSSKVQQTLGRIDGNFGSDSSISIFICHKDLTSSPSMSVIPSPIPSSILSSPPTLSQSPSMRATPPPSAEPSISAMPTTLNAVVTFELLTDGYPEDTSWLLIDNDKDGVIVQSGPGDGETYDGGSLYSFTWTLDRCTFYTFTISDLWGDGFFDAGYAELTSKSTKVEKPLGRIDGNFGRESSISFNICDNK